MSDLVEKNRIDQVPGLNVINFLFSFRYKAIVKYKTAFYSFYLPVAAAMYMVSVFCHDSV